MEHENAKQNDEEERETEEVEDEASQSRDAEW